MFVSWAMGWLRREFTRAALSARRSKRSLQWLRIRIGIPSPMAIMCYELLAEWEDDPLPGLPVPQSNRSPDLRLVSSWQRHVIAICPAVGVPCQLQQRIATYPRCRCIMPSDRHSNWMLTTRTTNELDTI